MDGLREQDHPLWLTDQVTLTSVGIDIGTATAQAVFSRLQLRRMARALSSRYAVVERRTWYRGPVRLTPFRDGRLDGERLAAAVAEDYAAAGVSPAAIDAGVVILTGEAAVRDNARVVGEVLAESGGQFVSVAAGHRLEAVLAAHGSGAVARSRTEASRVLIVDIGGGTTKFAVADRGVLVATAAIHVGGRLVAFDRAGRVQRLEPAGARLAAAAGRDWRRGHAVRAADVTAVAEHMATTILAAVRGDSGLWLTEPLRAGSVDAVVFSGGVAEYVYGLEPADHGDLGRALGAALAARLDELPAPVVPATARVRATVVGAAEYTVQVSGNTIHTRPAGVLPLRNLRVIRPRPPLADEIDPAAVEASIRSHLAVRGYGPDEPVAIALDWAGDPSYRRLQALAAGVLGARREAVQAGGLLCVVIDHDVAELIGAHLETLLAAAPTAGPLVVVDGVTLADLDHIDIGAVRPDSGSVAITVKSLLFGS
jgi:ethanolamine utilization protein EutA